jgi:hypothetical protein
MEKEDKIISLDSESSNSIEGVLENYLTKSKLDDVEVNLYQQVLNACLMDENLVWILDFRTIRYLIGNYDPIIEMKPYASTSNMVTIRRKPCKGARQG